MSWWSKLLSLPWLMMICAALLVLIGALALYSASEGAWSPWAEQHLIRAGIGAVLMLVMGFLPLRWISRMAPLALLAGILVLLALPFIGTGSGATRWINLGPLNLQPSEPIKVALVLVLAKYFASRTWDQFDSFMTYLPALVLVAVPVALVLMQPDLGTALMMGIGGLSMLFLAGLPRRWIVLGLIAGLASLPLAWSQLYDYQKARVLTFLNPGQDALGAGYQITQSKIALGSGGLFGKGFLMGSQSQLDYLPEKQTDFVFTMIGEEFGLIGNLAVLLIYFVMMGSVLFVGIRCENRFGRLLCGGLSMMLFLYVFVNVAMVTGLMPVVGAPLPLISYGGTAMLTVFLALGLTMNVSLNLDKDDTQII